jgi:hypothetical protein
VREGFRWAEDVTDNFGRLLVLAGVFGVPTAAVAMTQGGAWGVLVGAVLVVAVCLGEGAYRVAHDVAQQGHGAATELSKLRTGVLGSIVVSDFHDDRYTLSPDTCTRLDLRFEFSNHGPSHIDFQVIETEIRLSDAAGPCDPANPAPRDDRTYHLWPEKKTQYEVTIDFAEPQRFPLTGTGHFLIHYGVVGDSNRCELLHRFRLSLEPGIPGKCWADGGGHDVAIPGVADGM